jgi:hypothetical protein
METDYHHPKEMTDISSAAARNRNAALSVIETLARGMTNRFFEEMRERFLTKVLGRRPPAILKRAAAYRAECRWFEQSTPPDLIIASQSGGPQDGKTKDAYRVYLTWDMGLTLNRMMAVASIIDVERSTCWTVPSRLSPSRHTSVVSATQYTRLSCRIGRAEPGNRDFLSAGDRDVANVLPHVYGTHAPRCFSVPSGFARRRGRTGRCGDMGLGPTHDRVRRCEAQYRSAGAGRKRVGVASRSRIPRRTAADEAGSVVTTAFSMGA